MTRTAGIIAEYNPFHLGHQHLIREARQQAGADFVVVAMSGNFVQRGEPAIFEKSCRARMALLCGADLVLELPSPFAVGSAEDFAFGAVSLFTRLGAVDLLAFGSEFGRTEPLMQAAQILAGEPPAFRQALKTALCRGCSYPRAKNAGLAACGIPAESLEELNAPNNLLGIEYLKALCLLKSPLKAFTVRRKGLGYHSGELPQGPAPRYASASALRAALLKPEGLGENASSVMDQIPPALRPFYTAGPLFPVGPDDCSSILHYRILSCIQEGISFQDYSDFSPELAGRLENTPFSPLSFSQRAASLKTKQYTYTRVSRSLLHLLLDIRQEDAIFYRRSGYCSYARILGFKRSAGPLLRSIKANSSIPVVTKAASAKKILPPEALRLWKQDIHCSHVYHGLMNQKYGVIPANEYCRPPVIL